MLTEPEVARTFQYCYRVSTAEKCRGHMQALALTNACTLTVVLLIWKEESDVCRLKGKSNGLDGIFIMEN